MANPKIKIKRSSVAGKVPHYPSTLDLGEFAINTADGKVFIASGQAGVGIGTTVQEVGVSTALVLSGIVTSGSFVGPVTGDVTGNLTGNVAGDVTIGTPTIEGAKVIGVVEEQHRAKKITVFKFKAKHRLRKKTGHRQYLTRLRVTDIVSA